ncbi:hypothetical protein [Candidatus Nitrosotalea okcheonensis]|uniref:Uncharacterized protein n=1 Tax=Candidatus Nitrosotalea okcheonensis TaxID=1903276 RepID=A0A2H1FEG0_9ARCH|nr:hypothetical protein [Candidatus Nitrosotalea okcheonensis]SMH71148.1 protein of unknown function [Candidatus Nitrosotalea okcheonensis]
MRKILTITLVVIPILAGFSIYYTQSINTFFGTTYASNYLLIGLIMVEAFNGIFTYIAGKRSRLDDRREKHKEFFYDILDQLASSPSVYWETQTINKFSWCEHHDLFENLKSHLQQYELGKLYQQCRAHYDVKTDEMEQKIREFNNYIDRKLESFKDLPDSDEYLGQTKHHIMKKQFEKFMMKSMYDHHVNEYIPLCKIKINVTENRSDLLPSLEVENKGSIAVGDMSTLEKLLDILSPLTFDQNLMSIVKELDTMEKNLDESFKNRFNESRKVFLLDLCEGQQNLKGKCDRCPPR